jgi:hypothetical protein
LAEVNDLFVGWSEHPPTNILVKALVEGLGGGLRSSMPEENIDDVLASHPAANYAMQNAAVQAIAAQAGSRLPVTYGRDSGLPKTPPVFDIDKLREKNNALKIRVKFEGATVNV